MSEIATFTLIVSKVNELVYSGEAYSVSLPGTEGILGVLPHHEPLISLLGRGTMRVSTREGTYEHDVQHGLVEISHNQVTVLI